MSENNKKKELNDDQLDKVSGGITIGLCGDKLSCKHTPTFRNSNDQCSICSLNYKVTVIDE